MDNLEFRKFLQGYGISEQEFEGMPDDKKQELIKKYNLSVTTGRIDNITGIMQDTGCIIGLLIVIAVIIFFIRVV